MRFVFLMKLSDYLVVRMGRATRDKVVAFAMQDEEIFEELMGLVRSGNRTQRMKASWVLSGIQTADASKLNVHRGFLVKCLNDESVGGVKRELLRCFEGAVLGELISDELIHICMEWVTDKQQDLAVRYICYRLLKTLLKSHPDLKQELEIQIELFRLKFGSFP